MPEVRSIPPAPDTKDAVREWLKRLPSSTDQRVDELEKRLELLQHEAVLTRELAALRAEHQAAVEANRLLTAQMAEAKREAHERLLYFQHTVSGLLQTATAAFNSGPLSKPRKEKRSFSFTLALWKFYLRGEISS